MERFFIPTEKQSVEHETAWGLFFEHMLNSKSNPKKLVVNNSKENEKQINTKSVRNKRASGQHEGKK